MITLLNKNKIPYQIAPLVYTKNEGNKTQQLANRDKKKGLRSGYPDLKLDVARVFYKNLEGSKISFSPSLIVELKTKTGYMAHNQKKWRDYLISQGCTHAVCRSLDEFQSAVMEYMR